jgi:hypothetical protein
MKKNTATISMRELNEIGATASAEAIADAHSEGLATPSMIRLRLASGDELIVPAMSHPDGVLEIKDDRVQVLVYHGPETRSVNDGISSIVGSTVQGGFQTSAQHSVGASFTSNSSLKGSSFLNAKAKLFESSEPLQSEKTKLIGVGKR